MDMPSIKQRMDDKEVQKIYFTCYFYNSRALYKVAILDTKLLEKDRQKYITASANMMVRLEYTKGQDGWRIVEPLFKEYIKEKEAEPFKKEYDRLKAMQQKTASLELRRSPITAYQYESQARFGLSSRMSRAEWKWPVSRVTPCRAKRSSDS